MRRLIATLTATGTILVGIGLTVGTASPAGATTSTNETIVLHRDSAGTPTDWSASGTFTDSGTWTDPFGVGGGGLSPNVFVVEIKTAQTGSSGTFNMNFQGLFNSTTGTSLSGTWTISQGTGLYATLRGKGTWTRTIDPITGIRTITCPGAVHFN